MGVLLVFLGYYETGGFCWVYFWVAGVQVGIFLGGTEGSVNVFCDILRFFLMRSDRVVSSTYLTDLTSNGCGRSMMNTMKESGPKYDPWGMTPFDMSQSDTDWPSFNQFTKPSE